MNTHMHKFKFDCESTKGHKHALSGYTEYMIGIANFHIHYYFGITSYSGHTHYFSGLSGLPVRTANGHVHKMEGMLENSISHVHKYCSSTFEDVAYKQDGSTRMALT